VCVLLNVWPCLFDVICRIHILYFCVFFCCAVGYFNFWIFPFCVSAEISFAVRTVVSLRIKQLLITLCVSFHFRCAKLWILPVYCQLEGSSIPATYPSSASQFATLVRANPRLDSFHPTVALHRRGTREAHEERSFFIVSGSGSSLYHLDLEASTTVERNRWVEAIQTWIGAHQRGELWSTTRIGCWNRWPFQLTVNRKNS
jgi:hypothetical protein